MNRYRFEVMFNDVDLILTSKSSRKSVVCTTIENDSVVDRQPIDFVILVANMPFLLHTADLNKTIKDQR